MGNSTANTSTAGASAKARMRGALRSPRAGAPLILFMGLIGASLRYILEVLFPAQGGFPAATLIINLFGCFVLEIINAYVGRRMHLPKPLVKSLGIGLVGAFTTVAAFSTECLVFLQSGAYGLAASYIFLTLVGTFLAALAGNVAVRALDVRRMRRLQRRRQQLHESYVERHGEERRSQ